MESVLDTCARSHTHAFLPPPPPSSSSSAAAADNSDYNGNTNNYIINNRNNRNSSSNNSVISEEELQSHRFATRLQVSATLSATLSATHCTSTTLYILRGQLHYRLCPYYAGPGSTDRAPTVHNSATCLRACYAQFGTGLRVCYGMPGTDRARGVRYPFRRTRGGGYRSGCVPLCTAILAQYAPP
eukprot:2947214-Rhodomonas_salina.1